MPVSHIELSQLQMWDSWYIGRQETNYYNKQAKNLQLSKFIFRCMITSVLITYISRLQELHLSNNGYSFVNLDPDFNHTALKRLHINNNSLSDWKDFQKLSPAFPKLQILVATSNPLTEISPIDLCSALFPELKSLNLNSSSLEKWESVENLAMLAKLTDISWSWITGEAETICCHSPTTKPQETEQEWDHRDRKGRCWAVADSDLWTRPQPSCCLLLPPTETWYSGPSCRHWSLTTVKSYRWILLWWPLKWASLHTSSADHITTEVLAQQASWCASLLIQTALCRGGTEVGWEWGELWWWIHELWLNMPLQIQDQRWG